MLAITDLRRGDLVAYQTAEGIEYGFFCNWHYPDKYGKQLALLTAFPEDAAGQVVTHGIFVCTQDLLDPNSLPPDP